MQLCLKTKAHRSASPVTTRHEEKEMTETAIYETETSDMLIRTTCFGPSSPQRIT